MTTAAAPPPAPAPSPPPPGLSSLFYSFTRALALSAPPAPPPAKKPAPLEFDAGINASAAWTVHQRLSSAAPPDASPDALSDAEDADDDAQEMVGGADAEGEDGREARVLHDFVGQAEFREMSASAGDEVVVVREDAGEGWSLVRNAGGELGLLPRSYYKLVTDFAESSRPVSTASLTPRSSPKHSPAGLPPTADDGPIIVQTTGERMRAALPAFRAGLLRGKSLNRFSAFVTSGAEAYVLRGPAPGPSPLGVPATIHERGTSSEEEEDEEEDGEEKRRSGGVGEADRHYVDAGPRWREKVPPFRILVHSPSKRTSTLSGAYTVYSVTSLFRLPSADGDAGPAALSADDDAHATRITVHRRFSHFVVLHTALARRLPGLALPPLPEKQYAGRFADDFVEARRGDLERYLSALVRHPVARYAEVLTFFLGCESDLEWRRQLPVHLARPPAGPAFYANVYHPEFNFDEAEAREGVYRFEAHVKDVGRGVQGLRAVFGQARQARVEMSKAERLLSYALFSLVTGKQLATSQDDEPGDGEEEEHEEEAGEGEDAMEAAKRRARKGKASLNEEGAWCWRENCQPCLQLTKALVKTGETLQSVADLYDDHARRTQLHTHDMLKTAAHPAPLYAPVVDTHKNALRRYAAAGAGVAADEAVAARAETVLNTTMAELETYHAQKLADFGALAREHLDGELAFYAQVSARLRAARAALDDAALGEGGPRQPSIYERELEAPRLEPDPLPQPCAHVFDSAPMRPVSHAIQKGVSMLLGGGTGRASVFGPFW